MSKSKIWKILSWISFLSSTIFLCIGFDKMFSYDNGEYYPHTYHNAYVGGDAYNYIINGNYATAFFVLTSIFVLLGIGFAILFYLSKLTASSAVLEKEPDADTTSNTEETELAENTSEEKIDTARINDE